MGSLKIISTTTTFLLRWTGFILCKGTRRKHYRHKILKLKRTNKSCVIVLTQQQKLGFLKRVYKGWITTVKGLKSSESKWKLSRVQPPAWKTIMTTNQWGLRHIRMRIAYDECLSSGSCGQLLQLPFFLLVKWFEFRKMNTPTGILCGKDSALCPSTSLMEKLRLAVNTISIVQKIAASFLVRGMLCNGIKWGYLSFGFSLWTAIRV